MADGETVDLGRHRVTWIATPHLPHAWECGHLYESTTGTLFCGDLFTQFGADHPPVTEDDILEPSERMRGGFDYYSHTKNGGALIDKLARLEPTTLVCMHGSAWRGDGAALLRALGQRLET
jgi:flavorubredoxin